jgi:hypothetical protein
MLRKCHTHQERFIPYLERALRALVASYEWQQRDVPGTLDSGTQPTLLTFGQAGLLAGLDLSVLVHVALQGLEILVVKKRYIGPVLKYLCHCFLLKLLSLLFCLLI